MATTPIVEEQTAAPPPEEEQQPISYDLYDSALYINRELSLLEFNRRVLEEAEDETNPLLERAKFLAIYSSNMDEFFMVRVAGLRQQVAAGVTTIPADGATPAEQLVKIRKKVRVNMKVVTRCFHDIHSRLRESGLYLHSYKDLTRSQQDQADAYFRKDIFPVLTPLAVDPGRPFPHISSLSLNLAVLVRNRQMGMEHFARVKVPSGLLPRLVQIRQSQRSSAYHFVWLEDLIAHNLPDLFPGYEIIDTHHFRITRNADLEIEANEAGDLLETIAANIRRRRFGFVVRFTTGPDMPDTIHQLLAQNLDVGPEDTYISPVPLGLSGLMELMKVNRPDLKYPTHFPVIHPRFRGVEPGPQIFDAIREGDILLYHPYDSFDPVVDFLKAAARDPNVLAIKQTLYRAGTNSPVVQALMEAATENRKQVAALVELKARFDEESNIGWAKALESVGVHVVYGFMGLKTHTKICLVVRREGDTIRRYVHLSTGNYNAVTAQIYTDLGLFTCATDFGADASDLFNELTGYSKKQNYLKFLVAPRTLRQRFAALIEREIEWANKGEEAKLIFKMNALIDPEFVRQLYRASQAGVQIELMARSMCSLRPGLPDLSENIRVVSIVGRFLEHTRIYYFHNGGHPDIYLGSADLMPRNLDRRIETLFPIEDPNLKQELTEILEIVLADNVNARLMRHDGSYGRLLPGPDEEARDCQQEFIDRAKQRLMKKG